jgi:ssDNA thymidine ADP-ribosyltransferase, DarT
MTSIAANATARGVTRLCHLTPYRNLLQIAQGAGLRSVAELQMQERAAFDPQDRERLDGHPDHISCSVQYPNPWYLRARRGSATAEQRLFPDWVCLLIEPSHLDRDDALFCYRNAAAARGALLEPGIEAFEAMYDDPVAGQRGPVYRGAKPDSCPTDDQAEVMIPKFIPLEDANRVVVHDEEQARRMLVGLDLIGVPITALQWTIAPDFFTTQLSAILRSGHLPEERHWQLEP